MMVARRIVLASLLLCLYLLAGQEGVSAGSPQQSEESGKWRFGIVEAYEDPQAAGELGVGWSRIRFNWAEVQAGGPGTWTPAVSDEQIAQELESGRLVVGLLIGIPEWARGVNRLPRGLALPYDEPRNSWARFVGEAVERYEGRINHWIIWNEPDIGDPAAPGHTWDGTMAEFVQLQRVAYLVAKEQNPAAVVHLAAFTYYWDEGYFGRLLDQLTADPAAAAHHYYFDVATAHLYFQPDSIYRIIRHFAGKLERRGLQQPIWLVETNAPPMNDPAWPVSNWTLAVTVDEQAAFVPQALAAALAAGAERVAIYKLKDTAEDRRANPEPFGLLRENGSRRPAYSTYQVAIRYLSGALAATQERWDGVGQIRLDGAQLSTTVLFARLPLAQTAQVRATADSGALIDMWGQRRPVTAENGTFTIELPPALCTQSIGDYCMIGGTTYYLVQAIPAEQRGTLDPTRPPETTPTAEASMSPQPNATATATLTAALLPATQGVPTPPVTPTIEIPRGDNVAGQQTLALESGREATSGTEVEDDGQSAIPLAGGSIAEGEGLTAYLFLGAAALLAFGIGGWWLLAGRRRR